MIISRALTSEIESHFFNHNKELLQLDEIAREIAESKSYAIEPTGIRGTATADTIHNKAMQIENESKALRLWCEVVRETYSRFAGTLHEQLMKLTYQRQKHYINASMLLHMDKATYYAKRHEVVVYACMKAIEKGLIKV